MATRVQNAIVNILMHVFPIRTSLYFLDNFSIDDVFTDIVRKLPHRMPVIFFPRKVLSVQCIDEGKSFFLRT